MTGSTCSADSCVWPSGEVAISRDPEGITHHHRTHSDPSEPLSGVLKLGEQPRQQTHEVPFRCSQMLHVG